MRQRITYVMPHFDSAKIHFFQFAAIPFPRFYASSFIILHSHHLPHHAHPSLEVDFHEVCAGGIGREVDFGHVRAVGRIQEGGQFAALQVEQLDASVAVHVAAHGGPPVRGVGVEVDLALAVLVVLVDAHGVVGDVRLGELGIMVESKNGTGLPRWTIDRDIITKTYRWRSGAEGG